MNGIYLIIGGNMGKRAEYLATCKNLIDKEIGRIQQSSSLYETAAWGNTTQAPFLNQVLKIETALSPVQLLEACLHIEKKMGRIRDRKWDARIIDIDILFYGQLVINEKNLVIPHPHLPDRKFVLVPLHELAPNLIHPGYKQTITELLAACKDELPVKLFTEK